MLASPFLEKMPGLQELIWLTHTSLKIEFTLTCIGSIVEVFHQFCFESVICMFPCKWLVLGLLLLSFSEVQPRLNKKSLFSQTGIKMCDNCK